MALKHGSSEKLGMMELTGLLKAFETQNNIELVIKGQLVDGATSIDLRWTAMAYDGDPDAPEAKPLVSQSVLCMTKRLVRMEDVLLQLLYLLDFKLAEQEFAKLETKKA